MSGASWLDLIDPALQTALEAQLAKHQVAGASVAVFHRGQVRIAFAGLANAQTGVAVDERTIFQIGSITKVFTATLIAILVEQNLVSFDAPVTRYLPALRIAGRAAPDSMTVRTLLDYTAGVEGDFFRDFGRGSDALESYVEACEELAYVHRPGEMRSYNSTSYCIAGRIAECVTGLSFDAALRQFVLNPLGLECSAFYCEDIARFRTAVGHHVLGNGVFSVVEHLRLPYCMSAAGASVTLSAMDLLQFGLFHMQDGIAQDGRRILSAESTRELRTSSGVVPPNNSERVMGWASIATDRGKVTAASGRTIEQNSFLAIFPAEDFACAVLANTGSGGQQIFLDLGVALLQQATGATLSLPNGAPPAADLLTDISEAECAQFIGQYKNSYLLTVVWRDGALHATMNYGDYMTGKDIEQSFVLRRATGEIFWAVIDGQPSTMFEFLLDGSRTGHVSTSGRLYARLLDQVADAI